MDKLKVCDCSERVGIDITTHLEFIELNDFFNQKLRMDFSKK